MTLIWALFFFLIFALIVVIWMRRAGPTREIEDKRSAARIEKRQAVDKADQEKLTTAGWVDKEKGVVRLPIADAKKLVLAELKVKKVAASQVKVEPRLPLPPPYDPNAAEQPPPALPSAPQGADTIWFDAQPAAPAAAAVGEPHASAGSAAPETSRPAK